MALFRWCWYCGSGLKPYIIDRFSLNEYIIWSRIYFLAVITEKSCVYIRRYESCRMIWNFLIIYIPYMYYNIRTLLQYHHWAAAAARANGTAAPAAWRSSAYRATTIWSKWYTWSRLILRAGVWSHHHHHGPSAASSIRSIMISYVTRVYVHIPLSCGAAAYYGNDLF